MKKSLSLFAMIFFTLLLFSQNTHSEIYFTAFDGIPMAKEKAASLGLSDAKLIIISAYPDKSVSLGGALTRWLYILVHNNDSLCSYISVQETGGTLVAELVKESTIDNVNFDYFIDHINKITDFTEIPDNLLNSNDSWKGRNGENRPLLPDSLSSLRLMLTSKKNIQSDFDTTSWNFIWILGYSRLVWYPKLPGYMWEGGLYYVSADKGILLEGIDLVNIPEPSNHFVFVVSPNPATDFIEISVGANGCSLLLSGIKIFNVFGQNCNPTPTLPASREGVRIDISSLPRGMYFVRIGETVQKFIKL